MWLTGRAVQQQNAPVSLSVERQHRTAEACGHLLEAVDADLKTVAGLEALLSAALAVAAAGTSRDDADVPSDGHEMTPAPEEWSDRVFLALFKDMSDLVEARVGQSLPGTALYGAALASWSYRHGRGPQRWKDWYFCADWESSADVLLEECAVLHRAIFKPENELPGW